MLSRAHYLGSAIESRFFLHNFGFHVLFNLVIVVVLSHSSNYRRCILGALLFRL